MSNNKLTKTEEKLCAYALTEGLEVFIYNDGSETTKYCFSNLSDSLEVMNFHDEVERFEFYKSQLNKSLKDDAFCAYRRKFIVDNFKMSNMTPVTRDSLKQDKGSIGLIQQQTLKYKTGFPLVVDTGKNTNLFGRISVKTECLSHMIQIFRNHVVIRGIGKYKIASFTFDHPIQAVWFILDYVDVYSDWGIDRTQFGTRYKINYSNPRSKMSEIEIISYIIHVFQKGSRYTNPIIS